MQYTWDLDQLYTSFDDPAFIKDMELLTQAVTDYKSWAGQKLTHHKTDSMVLKDYLMLADQRGILSDKLFNFAQLSLSVNVKNEEALRAVEKIEDLLADLAPVEARFQQWVSQIPDFPEALAQDPYVKAHSYFFEELKSLSRHTLSEETELAIAKLQNTGSSAFGKLQESLTSSLRIPMEINGEKRLEPLSVIRNYAYDPDQQVRKTAYEAELNAYPLIEDAIASALNSIKGEVSHLCELRGYQSPLAMTLLHSRLEEDTLHAMFAAIEDSLPAFRKYFREKGAMLGHTNGLPFYDLFAPMGHSDQIYTYEEAMDFIIQIFDTFSQAMGDFARRALKEHWIDVYPKEGKAGGAFCANLYSLSQSRILANFGGSFSDIMTLAHELGHGYQNYCLQNDSVIHNEYPMPIAETASIFCETILTNAAIKQTSGQEALMILEQDIQSSAQTVVDIYSRFLFEKNVFDQREKGSLPPQDLCSLMKQAQLQTYGNGLDSDYLHPYMWICKSHYYDAQFNFYNFPYAFGLLLAKGLYAEYMEEGTPFVSRYDKLLANAGKFSLEDLTDSAGIHIRKKDFWQKSLKSVEKDIETFISLKNH